MPMIEVKLVTTAEQPSAAIRESVRNEDIASAIGRMFGELGEFLGRRGLRMAGPPFVYYHDWSEQGTDMECGFPVAGPFEAEGRIRPFVLPSVSAATAMHIGPYNKLMETYAVVEKWMRSNGHEPAGYMWERYLNEPGKVPDSELMTEIFWPIK
jgi:AraC family transcriptional regulator